MLDFNDIDVDGALQEQAAGAGALDADTRAAFFKKAGVAGGAILSSGAIMGMLPAVASAAPSKKQDLAILNFALTLEYLEAQFYKDAVSSKVLSAPVQSFANLVGSHELTHVSALRNAIKNAGGKAVTQPKFNFRGTTTDEAKFLATSFTLENTGVRAYLGQAGRIKNPAYLLTAATIVTIEARHASAAATLVNKTPFNVGTKSITPSGAFDRRSSMGKILAEVKATKFITG